MRKILLFLCIFFLCINFAVYLTGVLPESNFGDKIMSSEYVVLHINELSIVSFKHTKQVISDTFEQIEDLEIAYNEVMIMYEGLLDKFVDYDADWGLFNFLKPIVSLILEIPNLLITISQVIQSVFMFSPVLVSLVTDFVLIIRELIDLIFGLLNPYEWTTIG